MPLVSVVTPSYNGARHLERLLRSLAGQVGVDWEAVVVLDGSTDGSEAVVGGWTESVPVRCVPLPHNQGRAAALNAGFAAARGEVLVRCDDDLELPPEFLAHHAAHHEGQTVGLVGVSPDVLPDSTYARAFGIEADQRVRRHQYSAPPGERWRLWSGNVSVTRATYDLVGDYDESFREYGWEDVDWGYRLHLAGIPILVPDDIEALHHGPPVSGRDRARKAFDSGAARRLFEDKHPEADVPTPHADRSPWNLGVRATAATMRWTSADRVARVADSLAEHAPLPLARKLISLSVESAGLAGLRADRR